MNQNKPGNEGMDLMDIHGVLKNLPHRYPFLLIDRVLECSPDGVLVAIKNVTINEPYFQGHFPQRPIVPGVLILEALAQATAILGYHRADALPDKYLYYFVGIDKARFKRPVEPGDQLRLTVRLKRSIRRMWIFEAEATVDGELAASAELMSTVKELEP